MLVGRTGGLGTTPGREEAEDGPVAASGAAPAAFVSVNRRAPGHLAGHAPAGRRGASRGRPSRYCCTLAAVYGFGVGVCSFLRGASKRSREILASRAAAMMSVVSLWLSLLAAAAALRLRRGASRGALILRSSCAAAAACGKPRFGQRQRGDGFFSLTIAVGGPGAVLVA